MSSTNKTTYYDLPQFVDSDLFNPLVDDNDAYDKIDTALHNIADAEAGDASEIVDIKSRVTTAEGKIEALETQNGVEVLTTTAQTLSGAVNELDADVASLDGRLDIVEDDINNANTGLKVKVDALETNVGALENLVGNDTPLDTTAQTLSGAVNEIVNIGLAEPYAPVKTGNLTYTNSSTNKSTKVYYAIIDKAYKPRLVMAGDTLKDTNNHFIVADVGAVSVREKATVCCNASTMHSSETTSGTVIIDGEVKHVNDTSYSEWQTYDLENLYMTEDGKLHVIDTFASIQEMLALDPVWSFNGWQAIYKNGATVNGVRDDYLYPHTDIAQDNEGNYLVLTCGGRELYNHGMDYADIVDCVFNKIGFNATIIYGCDGGGSSSLIVHQVRQNALVENEVRKVPTMLVFCADVTDTYSDYESGYSEYLADIENKKLKTTFNSASSNPALTLVGSANYFGLQFYKKANAGQYYDYTQLMRLGYDASAHKTYIDALNGSDVYHNVLKLDEDNDQATLLRKEVLRATKIYEYEGNLTTNANGLIDSNNIVSGGIPTSATIIEAMTPDGNVLTPYIYNGRYWFVERSSDNWTALPNRATNIRIKWVTGLSVTSVT